MKETVEKTVQGLLTFAFFAGIAMALWKLEPYAPKVRASFFEILRSFTISGQGETTQEQFDDLRRQNHEHADRMMEIWNE